MICMAFVFQSLLVMAAENPTVALKSDIVREGDKEVRVVCKISGAQDITNGKLRITYDPQQVNLSENLVGLGLEGVLHEINDTISGNKKEGEIVIVFASEKKIAFEGEVLQMMFKLQDGVKAGDTLHFNVAAENLAGEGGEVKAEEKTEPVIVEEKNPGGDTNKPGGDTNKPGGGKPNKPGSAVQTGDSSGIIPLVIVMLLAGGATVYGVFRVIKKRK